MPSSAIKLVQRWRRTGSYAPGQIGGQKKRRLSGWEDWLPMRLQELFEDYFAATTENRKPQKFYPLPVPAPPEKQRIILKSPRWEM